MLLCPRTLFCFIFENKKIEMKILLFHNRRGYVSVGIRYCISWTIPLQARFKSECPSAGTWLNVLQDIHSREHSAAIKRTGWLSGLPCGKIGYTVNNSKAQCRTVYREHATTYGGNIYICCDMSKHCIRLPEKIQIGGVEAAVQMVAEVGGRPWKFYIFVYFVCLLLVCIYIYFVLEKAERGMRRESGSMPGGALAAPQPW